mmetsp:Transcript_20334/g.44262  ORF Transcript_20334/g.44262 Transcript_20334/m.44262 type:complete len:279 (-) Transcript_20334:491-1327(-)
MVLVFVFVDGSIWDGIHPSPLRFWLFFFPLVIGLFCRIWIKDALVLSFFSSTVVLLKGLVVVNHQRKAASTRAVHVFIFVTCAIVSVSVSPVFVFAILLVLVLVFVEYHGHGPDGHGYNVCFLLPRQMLVVDNCQGDVQNDRVGWEVEDSVRVVGSRQIGVGLVFVFVRLVVFVQVLKYRRPDDRRRFRGIRKCWCIRRLQFVTEIVAVVLASGAGVRTELGNVATLFEKSKLLVCCKSIAIAIVIITTTIPITIIVTTTKMILIMTMYIIIRFQFQF